MEFDLKHFQGEVFKVIQLGISKHPEFQVLKDFQFRDPSGDSKPAQPIDSIPQIPDEKSEQQDSNSQAEEEPTRPSQEEYINSASPSLVAFNARNDIMQFLDEHKLTYEFLRFVLLDEQMKVLNVNALFREHGGIGIGLLNHLWTTKEGLQFFELIIKPLVERVTQFDHALEIDPLRSKKGIRRNLDELLHVLADFIEAFYNFESLVSKELIELFRQLNVALQVKFPDVNLGGLICLRLVCPVIISPQKYVKEYEGFIMAYAQRTFILLAKILQRLANNSSELSLEPCMRPTNRFIKHSLPKWNAFFHKLVTGEDLLDSQTGIHVNEFDFISRSTLDMSPETISQLTPLLSRQSQNVNNLLNLEKQTGWSCNEEKKKRFRHYFKFFPETDKLMSKLVCDNIPGGFVEVYDFVRKNHGTKMMNPFTEEFQILQTYSENLRVIRRLLNMNKVLLSKREMVLLEYTELLPEERFGVICFSSTERDDAPTGKYIRAEAFGGYLIRAVTPTLTSVVFLFHGDGKGMLGKAPQSLIKMAVKFESSFFTKAIKVFDEEAEKKKKSKHECQIN